MSLKIKDFKPSKDRYKPNSFLNSWFVSQAFQTLKGSLQTLEKEKYSPAMKNAFQTLKGSLQTLYITSRYDSIVPNFKPSKDRYKLLLIFRLSFSLPHFKPSKDRYKPHSSPIPTKQLIEFQTLKGSLQTHIIHYHISNI